MTSPFIVLCLDSSPFDQLSAVRTSLSSNTTPPPPPMQRPNKESARIRSFAQAPLCCIAPRNINNPSTSAALSNLHAPTPHPVNSISLCVEPKRQGFAHMAMHRSRTSSSPFHPPSPPHSTKLAALDTRRKQTLRLNRLAHSRKHLPSSSVYCPRGEWPA